MAQSLNDKAHIYASHGRYDDAELLLVQALDMRKELLGKEHLDVAESLNSLAVLYQCQGRCDKAEPRFVQALQIYERTLGLESLKPDVQTVGAGYEVIVTDDGRSILAQGMIAEQYPWVHWVQGPQRGPAAN